MTTPVTRKTISTMSTTNLKKSISYYKLLIKEIENEIQRRFNKPCSSK